MIDSLVYPRRLFVIENDINWLGPVATTTCQETGQMIYGAMWTPGNFGFSLVGGHSHFAFLSSQTTDLDTYITHFLINGGTRDIKRVQTMSAKVTSSTSLCWTVPTLPQVKDEMGVCSLFLVGECRCWKGWEEMVLSERRVLKECAKCSG